MTVIDYNRVKCPKCGKSYFRVKENSGVGFTTLLFTIKPGPIYKDGELQNPTEAEPTKVRCECLECGCNFRVETHDVFGAYHFIDEDDERKENERKLAESFKVSKRETEKAKTELDVGASHGVDGGSLKTTKSPFINKYIEPACDDFSTILKDLNDLKEEFRQLKEQLNIKNKIE